MSTDVRYPIRFELTRLIPFGDPSYYELGEARDRYAEGRSLAVVSAGGPPAWYIRVAPDRHRFTVTFYSATRTPIREVTWEADADALLCRRIIDLFYPEGDPGGRVPYVRIVALTQDISADGVLGITLESPMGDDEFHERRALDPDRYRAPLPVFAEWSRLVELSAPPPLERFGLEALDAVASVVDQPKKSGGAVEGGWRLTMTPQEILRSIDAVVAGDPPRPGVVVLDRGRASVVPLILQSDGVEGSSDEAQRRMTVLADELRGGFEYRAGHGIAVDLGEPPQWGLRAYANALREGGTVRATFWDFGKGHGVVLVSTLANGERSLSVQVVPLTWVSDDRPDSRVAEVSLQWSWSDVGESSSASGESS